MPNLSLVSRPYDGERERDLRLLVDLAGFDAWAERYKARVARDIYYTGNPWYLITIGAAEFLYDAIAQWTKQGFISVDSTSLAFFQDLYPAAQVDKTYKPCNKTRLGLLRRGEYRGGF